MALPLDPLKHQLTITPPSYPLWFRLRSYLPFRGYHSSFTLLLSPVLLGQRIDFLYLLEQLITQHKDAIWDG